MNIASSISTIHPPRSAFVPTRRCVREASPRNEKTRESVKRYLDLSSRYTSGIQPTAMEPSARDRAAAAYVRHHAVMEFIAARRFRVPAADVLPLIHDVFLAYMRHVATIGDDKLWLTTATKNACLNYWRNVKGTEPLLDESLLDPRRLADDVSAQIDMARILRRVPKQCRSVLWLRFVEDVSAGEIALRCAASSSAAYGRQLVHRCLRAARVALASLHMGGDR